MHFLAAYSFASYVISRLIACDTEMSMRVVSPMNDESVIEILMGFSTPRVIYLRLSPRGIICIHHRMLPSTSRSQLAHDDEVPECRERKLMLLRSD